MKAILGVVCVVGVSVVMGACGEMGGSGRGGEGGVQRGGVAGGEAMKSGSSHERLWTSGWRFLKGDVAGGQEISLDDSGWRAVELPQDWSVEGAYEQKWASCTAWLPCGVGWYRKTFTMGAELGAKKGKRVVVRFDGVMNHATVWCNGRQVGERAYGYSSFTCDLTDAIRWDGPNVVAVRVDHEQFADSRWYAGSGIYRNVYLGEYEPLHVATNGTFVTTPKVEKEMAEVRVATTVRNDWDAVAEARVVQVVRDGAGKEVGRFEMRGTIDGHGEKLFEGSTQVAGAALWSPGRPAMYRLETKVLKGGEMVDRYETPFGIRRFAFDPAKGFSINGEGMKIKGVCVHQDAGALGVAVPIEVWERRLRLLKEAGVNAIRCSHNPPAPEFLDLCDRMGFLVMDEAFDEWTGGKKKWIVGHNVGTPGTDGYHSDFEKWADADIRDMVVRDRNHPSIIMWSIGNEIDYNNDPFPPGSTVLPGVAQRLIADVKSVDRTRPVTAACAFPATNLFKQFLDIEGYNYMERLYAGDHAAHPDRVMFGSENSHALASWTAVTQNDFIAGQFLWTGIDYMGEAGVWPSHASGAGLLNLAGFPKNQYYFRKSLWTEEPMVYLSTTGLGGGGRGAAAAAGANVYCFTNCDSVELFQEGRSLGSKSHAAGQVLNWPMPGGSGAITALGKKGTGTASFELKRAGPAVRLAAKSDGKKLRADGRAVAQVEVDLVDAGGVIVGERPEVMCALAGPGRILGIENGDTSSTESNQGPEHRLFQGRMMVYVQAGHEGGELRLTVSSGGVEGAGVTIPVCAVH